MPGPGYALFDKAERANVTEVLCHWALTAHAHSEPFGQDSQARRFEVAAAGRLGGRYCLAVNSGAAAVLSGLAALKIGPGDEIIVPGYVSAERVTAIVCLGATPVLAEIDQSLTLDPADVRAKITRRTRAILAVHVLGAACDLAALERIVEEHDLYLVEDVSQACGGTYRGQSLGTFGEVGAFSLDIFGVITGGGGGFLLTDDNRLLRRARRGHDDGSSSAQPSNPVGEMLLGLGLGMNEFTAAIARAQLDKLDAVLVRTRELKDELEARIPERSGMCRRMVHDPAGDCASVLTYLFDDAEVAEAVATRVGSQTLDRAPKRYRSRQAAALPRTGNVLARSVAITIGVSDRELGANFGLNTFSGPDEIDAVAEKFRTTVDQAFG